MKTTNRKIEIELHPPSEFPAPYDRDSPKGVTVDVVGYTNIHGTEFGPIYYDPFASKWMDSITGEPYAIFYWHYPISIDGTLAIEQQQEGAE